MATPRSSEFIRHQLWGFVLAVTGDEVAALYGFKQWFFCPAAIHGKRTAGVKPASCRRIYRAGDISGKHNTPRLVLDIRNRNA
jgi:hypothetical protein